MITNVSLSTLVNLANINIFVYQLSKEVKTQLDEFLNKNKIILEEEKIGVYTLIFPTPSQETLFRLKYAHILRD